MKNILFYLNLRKQIIVIILLLNTISITSCDIQKKRYSKGYTVNWNKKYSGNSKVKNNEVENQQIANSEYSEITSIENENTVPEKLSEEIIFEQNIDVQNIEIEDGNNLDLAEDDVAINYTTNISDEISELNEDKANLSRSNSKKHFQKKKNEKKTNGLAVASLVLSLLFFLLLVPTILSLIFGIVALVQIKKYPGKYDNSNERIAIGALVIDFLIITLILGLFLSAITAIAISIISIIFLTLIISSIKPIGEAYTPPSEPIKDQNKLKPKKEKKPNLFWLKNRLLILFIIIFGALLFIPLGL